MMVSKLLILNNRILLKELPSLLFFIQTSCCKSITTTSTNTQSPSLRRIDDTLTTTIKPVSPWSAYGQEITCQNYFFLILGPLFISTRQTLSSYLSLLGPSCIAKIDQATSFSGSLFYYFILISEDQLLRYIFIIFVVLCFFVGCLIARPASLVCSTSKFSVRCKQLSSKRRNRSVKNGITPGD